ncbi:MAG: HAD family hydrolase [Rubrivivax sp.]
MDKAVFLDRDGVLVHDGGYVHRVQDLRLLPGVVEGLLRLQAVGYKLVVVTNQSGIARGFYGEAEYQAFTSALTEMLGHHGVTLAAVYHCPHLPDADVPAYAQHCDCRKPAPGMVLRALQALDIDPAASVMIGDRRSDLQAGRAAGIARCVLIRDAGSQEPLPPEADIACQDLDICAKHLVS